MTDEIGLETLTINGTIFYNHANKSDAILNGEWGLSKCMFKNGYSIDCMLSKYQNINWLDPHTWDLNINNNNLPSRNNSYFGKSIDPYEVIFHKWFWHGQPTVNFEIIEKYVTDNV